MFFRILRNGDSFLLDKGKVNEECNKQKQDQKINDNSAVTLL